MAPPRMRSNGVGGGGLLYFKLGVGWCSYDASTRYGLVGKKDGVGHLFVPQTVLDFLNNLWGAWNRVGKE